MTGDPYQFLPPLAAEELDRLRESIRESGVLVPVVLDETGAIIDGYHRAMLADELGVPYRTETVTGLTEDQKRRRALTLNLDRRHLTDAQRTIVGREIEPKIRAEASEASLMNLRCGTAPSASSDALGEQRRRSRGARTTDRVAARVGLGSGTTYERNKRVVKEVEERMPELVPRLESGELTIRDATKALGRPKLAKAVPKTAPSAPVPELRRFLDDAHSLLMRLKTMRSHRSLAALVAGVEGRVLVDEVEAVSEEWATLARELRRAVGPALVVHDGGRIEHGRATGSR